MASVEYEGCFPGFRRTKNTRTAAQGLSKRRVTRSIPGVGSEVGRERGNVGQMYKDSVTEEETFWKSIAHLTSDSGKCIAYFNIAKRIDSKCSYRK